MILKKKQTTKQAGKISQVPAGKELISVNSCQQIIAHLSLTCLNSARWMCFFLRKGFSSCFVYFMKNVLNVVLEHWLIYVIC